MPENFIPINRDIRKHWIYKDSQYFQVWFEMLCRARYSKETTRELIEGQLVEIRYAEFVFGRNKWSKEMGITEQRLRTLIQKLVNDDMIEPTSKFNKFSLYRIKNYEKYNHQDNQQSNHQDNQQVNQQSNQQESQSYQGISGTGNQQSDHQDNQQNNQQHDQQSNQQSTISQPASNQQLTTKEDSKEREESNIDQDSKEKRTRQPKTYAEDSSPYKLALYLHGKIMVHAEESGVGHLLRRSNMQKWADDCRKLLDVDKVEKELIRDVIQWATAHHFWKTNILSASTLRNKFHKLAVAMNQEISEGKYAKHSGGTQRPGIPAKVGTSPATGEDSITGGRTGWLPSSRKKTADPV